MKRKQEPERRMRRDTDWRRPAAFSYHASRAARQDTNGREPNVVNKRRAVLTFQYWSKRTGLLIAVLVGIVCVASILSVSTSPRIVLLDNDSQPRNDRQYQQAAAQHLSSSIWNRNKITFDTAGAAADLQKRNPEIATVKVTLPLIGHKPIYYVTTDKPSLLLQSVNGRYVLDAGGRVLARAGGNYDGSSLPVVTDQSGLHAIVGKQVMSSREATFIITLQRTLASKDIELRSLILPVNTVHQLDATVVGKPYTIKFNMYDDTTVRQQVGTYMATATMLEQQKTVPSQYVDVRVAGRAYYQ